MGDVAKTFPDSLDEILDAVRETPRGRWFLEQYDARLRSGETNRILEAIGKLESHLQAHASGTDAGVLARAREAIANAKREIAALEPNVPELSHEAQLFAKLAEKAKAALAGGTGAKGVARALQLVGDLDRELSPHKADVTHVEHAALPPQNFFAQDEALFNAAPAPETKTPILVDVASFGQGGAETQQRGAKLVIRRLGEALEATTDGPTPSEATPTVDLVEPAPAPQAEEESRIVIVRRSADEMEELPLPGEPNAA